MVPQAVNPFRIASSIFFRIGFSTAAATSTNAASFQMRPRAQKRLGLCELEENQAGKCRRRVALGPDNIRVGPPCCQPAEPVFLFCPANSRKSLAGQHLSRA